MNSLFEKALDIIWIKGIREEVKSLKQNVLDMASIKKDTNEALTKVGYNEVSASYLALAHKVGITDKDSVISDFIIYWKDNGFRAIHTQVSSLAQQWGANIASLTTISSLHTSWPIVQKIAENWSFARTVFEMFDVITSPSDFATMVTNLHHITDSVGILQPTNGTEIDNSSEKLAPHSIISPIKNGVVTSDMDDSRDHGKREHNARDIVPQNPKDTQVVCVADGIVKEVWYSDEEGHYVVIEHTINWDTYTTSYVHFDKKPKLAQWKNIKQWTPIAAMGWLWAHSTWPHLHFKVRKNGDVIDPGLFLNPQEFTYKQHGKVVAFKNWEHADQYQATA